MPPVAFAGLREYKYGSTQMEIAMQTFNIVWPEQRRVTASKIIMWADDAIANGEIDPQDVDIEDAESCAQALHDAGLITRGR